MVRYVVRYAALFVVMCVVRASGVSRYCCLDRDKAILTTNIQFIRSIGHTTITVFNTHIGPLHKNEYMPVYTHIHAHTERMQCIMK